MQVLIGVLLLCGAACSFGQTLALKEGLWETTMLNDDGSPSTRTHDCVTQKAFLELMSKAGMHPGCKVTNQNISSHGFTIDVSCDSTGVQVRTHTVMELLDPEHQRTTTNMKVTVNGKSNDSTTKSTGHFLKSDCGSIKPGERDFPD